MTTDKKATEEVLNGILGEANNAIDSAAHQLNTTGRPLSDAQEQMIRGALQQCLGDWVKIAMVELRLDRVI
jgi:hypothetical protein